MRDQTSRLTGKRVPTFYIHSDSRHFRDTSGRTLLLRGVNLSGSAKIPAGHPHHILDDFWESAENDGLEQLQDRLPRENGFSKDEEDDIINSQVLKKNKSSSSSSSKSSSSSDDSLLKSRRPRGGGISYVGQNLNLEDGSADLHLTRLRQWGFNCVRFVTVWEALEHQGPGQYDVEYMDYVVETLRKCKEHGFRVYIDPHQDLFSRFCGGSGAPLWTLYACGLNPRNFTITGAAFLQAEWPHPDKPDPASFPAMIWATNYTRLACQTVNTMFWAGRDYAPRCIIDGINIQDYLQYHFLEAYRRLAMRLSEAGDLLDSTVIGWDSLNEPNPGYLGLEDVMNIPSEVPLQIGPTPTAIQGMKLGMGRSCKLENYRFGPLGSQRDGHVLIDPNGKRAWLDPSAEPDGLSGYGWRRDPGWKLGSCIWAQHGVWDPEDGKILKADYFAHSRRSPELRADFAANHWRPHLNAYCHMVRQVHPEAILFVHPPVFQIPPNLKPEILPILEHRSVFSSHFYDGLTLITKHWNWFNADALGILRGKYPSIVFGVKIGETAIRKCMRSQLSMIRQDGLENMGAFPTMMGEIGIPYDMDKRKAYKDGDYSSQIKAMDASLNACDGENLLSYTIWCYCPSNSHRWGDLWNGEDLSLWSSDDANCQASMYSERSAKYGKKLGRPFRYNYGSNGQGRGVTPNSSDVTLINRSETQQRIEPGSKIMMMVMENDLSTSPNSYRNLNDGARALAAFCRPYPVATVGTPTYFNFDIATASFEMTVEIENKSFKEDDDDNDDQEGSERGELATEIYVPASHFGSLPEESSGPFGQARRFKSESNLVGMVENLNGLSDSSLPLAIVEPARANNSNDPNLRQRRFSRRTGDDGVLDLDVQVSVGRWETQGQILRWYYSKELGHGLCGAAKVTHSIKVKRRAGPIVIDENNKIW
ncbi:cytoplasm protein [Phakopsora pachyrhizi]|nr:cytoplasm protein [Phakopsora pachyrhizi]